MYDEPFSFRLVVRGALVGIGLLLVLAYVLYQARFLLAGPQITLTSAPNALQHERIITLSGQTSNISHLSLNGRPIFTDPDGNFETDVVLENGYTITTLAAEDRYGRTTSLTREFVYLPMSFARNQ